MKKMAGAKRLLEISFSILVNGSNTDRTHVVLSVSRENGFLGG